MSIVKVGVLGVGYWGPKLVNNFSRNPNSAVVGVADRALERAQATASEFRVPLATADENEIINHPEIDLVVVATPVWTHYGLAKAALEAGKHVLVMKPLTAKTEEAEELCEIAARKGLLLAVDHTFVFTGAVQKIKSLYEAGELGELYYFDSVRINLGLFQHDVNVLWDLAPHDLSILDYLVGTTPDEVSAVGMRHLGSRTENIAYLTLRYGDSFLAHVHANWLAPAKIRRTIVGGSKKMLVYDDMEPSEKIRVYDKGAEFLKDPTDETRQEYKPLVSYRSGDMWAPQTSGREALAVEAENIIDAIRGKASLLVDGQAGTRVVRILEAAERSIEQGGTPVALESAGRH